MLTIAEYMSFFVVTLLLFGVSFELPLILIMLGIIGLIDIQFLKDKRRFAYVGLSIVAAALTPPDVISQVMMAAPLILLYGISIYIAKVFNPASKDEDEENDEEE